MFEEIGSIRTISDKLSKHALSVCGLSASSVGAWYARHCGSIRGVGLCGVSSGVDGEVVVGVGEVGGMMDLSCVSEVGSGIHLVFSAGNTVAEVSTCYIFSCWSSLFNKNEVHFWCGFCSSLPSMFVPFHSLSSSGL